MFLKFDKIILSEIVCQRSQITLPWRSKTVKRLENCFSSKTDLYSFEDVGRKWFFKSNFKKKDNFQAWTSFSKTDLSFGDLGGKCGILSQISRRNTSEMKFMIWASTFEVLRQFSSVKMSNNRVINTEWTEFDSFHFNI